MDTNSSTNITTSPSHQSNSSTELVGWQDESSGRGSLSIVLSCLYTTAICTWVVIHARIDRREKFRVAHKLALCFKTFLAPEFIAVEAAQEWTQAQLLWPNQFQWLLEQGHFEWSHHPEWGLSEEVIKDKSNADSAAKLFALAQSVWFVARCATRAFHHFPISPLESMTLGYIPLFMIAYLFWWVKPKDIELPSIIDLPVLSESQQEQFENLTVDDSFDEEGKVSQTSLWSAWYLTPRVFEKEQAERDAQAREEEYAIETQLWQDHRNKCLLLDCQDCRKHKLQWPSQRKEIILSHWDPELYHSRIWPITCLAGISFPALHLICWNTVFPTPFESWLWRGAAIASIVSMLIFMHFEKITVHRHDPWLGVKVASPAIYLCSRMVMLGLAAAAFRASEPMIYETYESSGFWSQLL
ncbi:hypothetical protein BTJ68_02082 [Hortaea werneckii EXF-2000]|uniref:Uncharacterized protein n=1 Tax=Hortaea werneckii EXF-2000 TaxID=1157616 RepID=A0A1Z5TPQ9_HORWE|nr:hypothetical protein BTJ68_02082 [Hortaea werneckii EXF-2000]